MMNFMLAARPEGGYLANQGEHRIEVGTPLQQGSGLGALVAGWKTHRPGLAAGTTWILPGVTACA
ncbi:hypothetical protein DU490_16615 [Halomonas sp. DQ26W]|nr:hypothetical protein DU490_16615 [Halomonas sp. DQ26W]